MIRICIPFYNEFETCKPGLREIKNYGLDIEIISRQGTYIHSLRNDLICDTTLGKGCKPLNHVDRFIFIDSDIDFKLEHLLKLINTDKDIVGAPYLGHGTDYFQCFQISSQGIFNYKPGLTGLQMVDAIATGFLAIKKKVFEAIPYPWFYHPIMSINGMRKVAGEDFTFCVLAKKYGFDTWCDFDIKIEHKQRKREHFNWEI